MSKDDILVNKDIVLEKIAGAKSKFLLPKSNQSTELIGVSKTHDMKDIMPLIDCGYCHFGENRVQDAMSKWSSVKKENRDICLHMIGHLQTNKVKEAVGLFDVIQTLDRVRLADSLAKEFDRSGRKVDCFIQVNTGDESQKAGINLLDVDNFIKYCRDEKGLPIVGLMCLPPANEDVAMHFSLLKKIARRNDISGLSMGMSGDYEIAVAMGATHVRVGSAIFGERKK